MMNENLRVSEREFDDAAEVLSGMLVELNMVCLSYAFALEDLGKAGFKSKQFNDHILVYADSIRAIGAEAESIADELRSMVGAHMSEVEKYDTFDDLVKINGPSGILMSI